MIAFRATVKFLFDVCLLPIRLLLFVAFVLAILFALPLWLLSDIYEWSKTGTIKLNYFEMIKDLLWDDHGRGKK